MSVQQQQTASTWGSNQHYHEASIIKIRLETAELLNQIENYLKGSRLIPVEVLVDIHGEIITEPEEGKEYETRIDWQTIETGESRANDRGVQGIMAFISSIVNPAVVQGNHTVEQWQNYVFETNISLVKMLLINQTTWGMEDEDVEPICDHVMSLVGPFMSRTIDNGERDSYETKVHTIESNTIRGKGFGTKTG